jgi:hypothetical protein
MVAGVRLREKASGAFIRTVDLRGASVVDCFNSLFAQPSRILHGLERFVDGQP